MSEGKKMPLGEAQTFASELLIRLSPVCERMQAAGSIRRQCPEVGDIELVAVPKRKPDLFGLPGDSLLDSELEQLVVHGFLTPVKGGDRYKQFWIHREPDELLFKLDLFVCQADTWGVIFTIRTGPAEFSRRLVTTRREGGLMPSHLRVKDGRIWTRSFPAFGA